MKTLQIYQWQEIINYLFVNNPKSISEINRDLMGTYSHTIRIIFELEKLGLLNKKVNGRIHIVSLTQKGKKFGELCNKLIVLIKRMD